MESRNTNKLIAEYRLILNNLAYKFTNDADEIQDLVQETLFRALKYMNQLIHNSNVVGWLYVIMKNIYINLYKKRQQKFLYDRYVISGYKNQSFQEPFIENSAMESLVSKDIQLALKHYSFDQKELFNHYINGYKYKELAMMYGIPEGTIKSRIFLIKKSLQKKLAQYQNK